MSRTIHTALLIACAIAAQAAAQSRDDSLTRLKAAGKHTSFTVRPAMVATAGAMGLCCRR